MNKEIIQNDVLLFIAMMIAPLGVGMIAAGNVWAGLAVCFAAAVFVFIRTYFKIDTANKAVGKNDAAQETK